MSKSHTPDPRKLRPADLLRLLNSTTSLGTVTSAGAVRQIRDRFGFRVGDGNTIDLIRWAAVLLADRHARLAEQAEQAESDGSYEAHRTSMAERQRAKAILGRDIGPMPAVKDWRRRIKATRSLRAFLDLYGQNVFWLKWSEDHLKVIRRLEEVCSVGGQFAVAMPRGSGKTSMVAWATLWSILTGRRRMVVIVGADQRAAGQMLDLIRGELETNQTLAEDWPEATFPIHRLDGIAQRAVGQLCLGQRTMLSIGGDGLALPTVPDEAMERPDEQRKCRGALIRCVGITGRIRGMSARTADGAVIRPSLVLIDDPQTDESARSPTQCDERERLVSGAILGLSGPAERMATLAAVTVIRPDDLADRLLQPERHPDWTGERTQLVYDWGTATEMWRQYQEIRRDPTAGPVAATKFYRLNRKLMDAGSVVAWPQRKEPHHLSALQYAWDLRIDRGEDAFFAEYQNQPLATSIGDARSLSPDEMLARTYYLPRGMVPAEATVLTAGIDVQGSVLYWMVCAWTDRARGWIVDYGTFPEQPSGLLALHSVSVPLSTLAPGENVEAQMMRACLDTFAYIDRDWQVETGGVIRLDASLIDSGWGQFTDLVRSACKQSGHRVFPAKGVAIGAKSARGINDVKRSPGDRFGLHWRSGHPRKIGQTIREYRVDVNWWKSWVLSRFLTPIGTNGAMVINGDKPADIRRHRQLSDQITAEEAVMVEAQGRRVEEWRLKRPGADNHFLDCLVLASVAANMSGVSVEGRDADDDDVVVLSKVQSGRQREWLR